MDDMERKPLADDDDEAAAAALVLFSIAVGRLGLLKF